MSKILIKDPKKMNMCDACKVPKASQKEVDAFLIQLRAHGFDTAAVNDVSKMIKSGGVSSTGRGFGPKTRRLCAQHQRISFGKRVCRIGFFFKRI